MSYTAYRNYRSASTLRENEKLKDAKSDILDFLNGCYSHFWELSQEEADAIAENRTRRFYAVHDDLMKKLFKQGKSAGARYIAARINSGAEPDLRQLALDWRHHRAIKRELSAEELKEIKTDAGSLRRLGIKSGYQARQFYNLYKEVCVKNRPFGSCYQPNKWCVLRVALTPNYNRLPTWVKKGLVRAPDSAKIGGDRIGNIWRLIPCVKAWKMSPFLPKRVAEKIGKCSPKLRMLSEIAWNFSAHTEDDEFKFASSFTQKEQVACFWENLHKLQRASLTKQIRWIFKSSVYWGRNKWATFLAFSLRLPWGVINLPKQVDGVAVESAIVKWGTPKQACEALFGVAGKATVKAFLSSKEDNRKWASALFRGNADAVQKVLNIESVIAFEPEVIDFLASIPVAARLRLLQPSHFKYRGQAYPVTKDHIRDTGYLWNNIRNKPELGRIRCWFSIHEILAEEFVKELPDEVLPIPKGWERVDGLCAVDGSWELEFPKRVDTLKNYGKTLSNCVGGYGNAIKSGRSVIFVVRERGQITHCVEVSPTGHVRQFYQHGNRAANPILQQKIEGALKQAGLIVKY